MEINQGVNEEDAVWGHITGTIANQTDLFTNFIKLDQTTPQTTVGRFTFPAITVDTDSLYVDETNHRVGVGTIIPVYKLDVKGTTGTSAIRSDIGFDIYQVPNPTAPTGVVSAGGSVDTGAHWYGITYTTALGETNITYSAAQITTTAGNNTVTLTIPVSTDPRVTGRKIYRSKAGGFAFQEYLLATITNNTETSYVDTTADSSLTGSVGVAYFRTNTTSNNITLNGTRASTIDRNATAFGILAGASLTTGGRNTFFGYTAGSGVTSGNDNTAIGHNAMGVNTSSNNNIAIGSYALRVTTGGTNVGVGSYSLFSNTTGNNNTTIGFYSLGENIGGGSNVAVGSDAGRYIANGSTGRTTGNNGLYLGHNSKASANGTENEIVIGYNAIGNGSNTTTYGNTSITKHIFSNGNVGIGTTTPSRPLSVVGNGTVSAGEAFSITTYNDNSAVGGNVLGYKARGTISSPTQVLTDDVLGGMYGAGYQNNNAFSVFTGAVRILAAEYFTSTNNGTYLDFATTAKGSTTRTVRMVLSDTGNLGIGNSNPTEKLVVESSATGGTQFRLNNTSTNGRAWHIISSGSANSFGAGRLAFYDTTTSLTRMLIDLNGNVGIGTTNPAGKLDVWGSTFPVGKFERSTTLTDGAFDTLNGIASGFLLKTSTTGNMGDGFGGGFIFATQDDTLITDTNYIARFYARRDGADETGMLQFWTGAGGNTPSMTIRGTGRVGIGTTAPSNLVHISGTDSNLLRIQSTSSNSAGIIFQGRDTSGDILIRTATSDLTFFTNGSERMRITSAGSVGVGTTAPDVRLHVYNGSFQVSDNSATTTGLRIDPIGTTSGGTAVDFLNIGGARPFNFRVGGVNALYINSSGNVGIGTTAPTSKLHVVSSGVQATNFASTLTDLSGFIFGSTNTMTVNPSAASTAFFYSNYNQAITAGANISANNSVYGLFNDTSHRTTATLGGAYGLVNRVTNFTTGTISAAVGGSFTVVNSDTGTIASATGISITTPTNATGTITNTYGLNIASQTVGTQTNTPYAIYQAGTTDKNYFAGLVGVNTTTPTTKLSVAEKAGINELGGIMIKLTNKTGANSVKGTVVYASPTTDNAFAVNPIDGDMPLGIVWDNGIADGAECWVTVSGIAEVLLVNSVATTRSYIAYSSNSVAGRIDTAATVPAATTHFREIGHTLENKTAGTNVLVKCVLHFN